MEDNKLKIERVSKDRWFTTICLTGLSVEEMNEVLNRHDALGEIMERHGKGWMYDEWHNGYGIYSIRHCGADLFVQIGNSCD